MPTVSFPTDVRLITQIDSQGHTLDLTFAAGVPQTVSGPVYEILQETFTYRNFTTVPDAFTLPPAAVQQPLYTMAAKEPWWGTGATTTVNSVATFNTALSAAANGDTIQWADGTYDIATPIVINKKIRVKAQNPRGALFRGTATGPTSANQDPGHTVYCFRTNSAAADGVYFEDMYFKWFGVAIDLDSTKYVFVQGNKIESCYDVGIQTWDCINPTIQLNEFWDPYIGTDTEATLTASGSVTDAQMDYGVNFYGCSNPTVKHNYFFGVFNQALSFKEGNRNPTANYNTFEGTNLTSIIFGQNKPANGPYGDTGLSIGPDQGNITCVGNVIRPVKGAADGKLYRTNIGIRVWHTSGDAIIKNNVIEVAAVGITVENSDSPTNTSGGAQGTVLIEGNTIGGNWRSKTGVLTDVGNGGIRLYKGAQAVTTMNRNTLVLQDTPIAYCYDPGNAGSCPAYSEAFSTIVTTPYSSLDLKSNIVTYDPDLSWGGFTRSNRITNPSFEANLNDWVTSGVIPLAAGANLIRTSAGSVGQGLYVGTIATNGTTNSGAAIPVTLAGGVPYRFRLRFRRTVGTATARIGVMSAGGTDTTMATAAADASMTEYTMLFTPPTDGTYYLYCRQNAGTSSQFQIDGAFASTHDVPYFDGDTYRNAVVNRNGPAVTGWTTFSAAGADTIVAAADTTDFEGQGMTSNVTSHAATADWYIAYGDYTAGAGVGYTLFPVEPGEVWGFRARLKLITTLPTSTVLKLYGSFQTSTFSGSTDVLLQSVTLPAPGTGQNVANTVIDVAGVATVPASRNWGYPQIIATPPTAQSPMTVRVGHFQAVKLNTTGDTNPPYMPFDRSGWDGGSGYSTSWWAPAL